MNIIQKSDKAARQQSCKTHILMYVFAIVIVSRQKGLVSLILLQTSF